MLSCIQEIECNEWIMATDYGELALYFKALAHPARLQILDMLRRGEVCVCHIETALRKRQPYVSQQLMLLREAGLVESRKDGLQVYYRLVDTRIADILEATCGSLSHSEHKPLMGCPCPVCTTESVSA